MIELRKSDERGRGRHGWLDARHSFSFANYHDRAHMGHRVLRVINEDRIAPGAGFPTHPHRDMEIITYVIEGALAHKDSTGGEGVIRPGVVQYMAAGSGVQHSEFNASDDEAVHLLQIWIEPAITSAEPRYEERAFAGDESKRLIASGVGREGSIEINQNADLYGLRLTDGESLVHDFGEGRAGWVQVISGAMRVNDVEAGAGDGVKIAREPSITIRSAGEVEALLFDLP